MNRFKRFVLTALAAAMVGTGALAVVQSASARNDDDLPPQHQQCWLHTPYGIAFFADGSTIKVADANGRLPEAEAMFDRLGKEQLAVTIQDEPVIELLDEWVRWYTGEEVSTGRTKVGAIYGLPAAVD